MKKTKDSKKEKLKELKETERKIKRGSKKSKKKKTVHTKVAVGILGTMAGLLAAGYAAGGVYYQDKFFPGTTINGQNCSNQGLDYARSFLKKEAETYSLTIQKKENQTETISGDAIQITYEEDSSLEDIKKEQNPWKWPLEIFQKREYEAGLANSYNEASLTEAISQLQCLQDANMTPSQEARIEDNGTSYEIIPEVVGTALDKEKTAAVIKEAVDNRQTEVSLEETGCYLEPAHKQNDETMQKEVEQLNRLTGLQISLNFGSGVETITRDMLKSWLKKGEDGNYTFDESIVKPQVIAWSEVYNTYGKPREFTTTGGWSVQLSQGDYGWRLWQDKTTESLMAALNAGQSGEIEVTWLYKGQMHEGNDIDGTYVEISIEEQRMWFYKDGACLVDTPVVTGDPTEGNDTPAGGVWRLKDKASPSTLVGRYPDGTIEYETPVTFWLPFNGGVGIHDLSTRYSYGGDIYVGNGSHGCVNTPYDAVQTIYENIEVNTPIVVY